MTDSNTTNEEKEIEWKYIPTKPKQKKRKRKRMEIPITDNLGPPKKKTNKNVYKYNDSDYNDDDMLLSTLRNRFGYNSFRSSQRNAINSALNGFDTLVLMPTGGGKSLCFQIVGLLLNKLVIVISPLISLMKNQCDLLNKRFNINATFFNSTVPVTSKKKIILNLAETYINNKHNKYKKIEILYTTPETLKNYDFSNIVNKLVSNNKICLFAIDECHCISSWGQGFRPSYRTLTSLRINYPKIPIMAVTATATINVRNDIIKNLKLNQPTIIVSSFDRPNLYFEFKYIEHLKVVTEWISKSKGKQRWKRTDLKTINKNEITKLNQKISDDIYLFIKSHNYKHKIGLIYVFSRKDAETIAFYLKRVYKLSIESYHAGMSNKTKTEIQENWQNEHINIIVATCAFGMGINKKNVRFVIHCTINKCLEAYYQEVGRAGRDNRSSHVLCYYSVNMLSKHIAIALKDSISKISEYQTRNQTKQEINNIARNNLRYKGIVANLKYVQLFAEPNTCRRRILLNYFNEKKYINNDLNRCCDYCDNPQIINSIKLTYSKKRKGKNCINESNLNDIQNLQNLQNIQNINLNNVNNSNKFVFNNNNFKLMNDNEINNDNNINIDMHGKLELTTSYHTERAWMLEKRNDFNMLRSLDYNHANVKSLISMGFAKQIINKSYCLLQNNNKTKNILPDNDSFIIQMLDKINEMQQNNKLKFNI